MRSSIANGSAAHWTTSTKTSRVVGVEVVDSSKTLAQKVRFRLEIEGSGGLRRTNSYCVKAHLDGSPGVDLLSEALFYRDLAPLFDVRTPRAYYTAIDAEAEQAMIIMDDVVDLGGQFLSAHTPYSLDTTRDSLAQLAPAPCIHVGECQNVGPPVALTTSPPDGRVLSQRGSPTPPQ